MLHGLASAHPEAQRSWQEGFGRCDRRRVGRPRARRVGERQCPRPRGNADVSRRVLYSILPQCRGFAGAAVDSLVSLLESEPQAKENTTIIRRAKMSAFEYIVDNIKLT